MRMRQLRAMDVQMALFDAGREGGENLAGIVAATRIEGAFDPALLLHLLIGEHFGHQVALLDADAMLASEDAADLDAETQDIGAKGFGLLELARLGLVEHDQGM